MDTLLATILDQGHHLVEAERCSLFFVDEARGELWTKVATDRHGAIKVYLSCFVPKSYCIVRCLTFSRILLTPDICAFIALFLMIQVENV